MSPTPGIAEQAWTEAELQALPEDGCSHEVVNGELVTSGIEMLSPNNNRSEIDARLGDFFSSGTVLAWMINPELAAVKSCPLGQRERLGPGGFLDGEALLPGSRYASLFKEWEWE